MKKFIAPFFALLISSCATTSYYQVYKTSAENGIVNNDRIVFQDNNCIVYYNLWMDGGNVGFSFYNKSENDITIHLDKTFFVLNGIAHEYFQNRTISQSLNAGTTVSSLYYRDYWSNSVSNVAGSSSKSFTSTYVEKPQLTIPPKSLINI
jgi:hypothetical protein